MDWDEYDDEDDEEELLLLSGAFFLGIERVHELRVERRNHHRRYLCRPQLLPNPRENTPWQALYNSRVDRAYITTMGIDVATFDFILASGFEQRWNTTPIPRQDADFAGAPRLGGRSLDAAGALGLYLHYISSAMPDTALQLIFALVPTTISRYRDFAQELLRDTLREIRGAAICWGVGEDFAIWSAIIQVSTQPAVYFFNSNVYLIQERHPLLVGAIGSLDGVKFPVQVSDDPHIENATYNGWLHSHCITCIFAFSPVGK
jgi:hypothetical protein